MHWTRLSLTECGVHRCLIRAVVWRRPQNQTSMGRGHDSRILRFISRARSFFNVRLVLHRVLQQSAPYQPCTETPHREFGNLESQLSHLRKNQDGHLPCNPTRYRQRDCGSPRQRLRLSIHPNMRPRVQIMASTVSATPLPRHQLHFEECRQMGQDIPDTGRESRSPGQGFACLDRTG